MDRKRWRHAFRGLALAIPIAVAGCAGWFETTAPRGKEAGLDSMLRLGAAAQAAGDLGNAISVYRRAQALYPDAAEPSRRLGDLYRDGGHYDLAAAAYADAIAADADDRDARHGLAVALVHQGRLAEAAEQYDWLVADDRSDIRAWNGRAVVQDLSGDHAAAWESFRSGLDVEPDNVALLTNLGLSLALGGRYDEAIETLERAAAEPGAGSETRQNLALAYGLAGRPEEAARLGSQDLREAQVTRNLEVYDLMRAAKAPPSE